MLTILGSNSATPTSARHSSAQVLDTGRELFLIDCAEGTQIQMRRLKIRFQRINHIFISHLHGDHFFGLIGLITTYHLLGRDRPLHLYAHPDLQDALETLLRITRTPLRYPVLYHFLESERQQLIYEDRRLTVHTLPLLHRIPTCGFLFREKPGPRKIRKEMAAIRAVPLQAFSHLQAGEDFLAEDGTILKNSDFTMDPPKPISYAYCTDTGYHEPLVPMIAGVDYLFHEATFLHQEVTLAREKQHSTARDAATIAGMAGAGQLLLGHFSSRYKDLALLLQEARSAFPATVLAEEGLTMNLK